MVSEAGLFVRGGDVVSGAYSPFPPAPSFLCAPSILSSRFRDIYYTLFVPSHPRHVVVVAVAV